MMEALEPCAADPPHEGRYSDAASSDDEGEQSDSMRSDSTRVPSVAAPENPRVRWADVQSEDEETSDHSVPWSIQTGRKAGLEGVWTARHGMQGQASARSEKAKRRSPLIWTKKTLARGGTAKGCASSSGWSEGTGDDHWWNATAYGTWDASWGEWWEPVNAYDLGSAAPTGWSRGACSAAASKWVRSRGGNPSTSRKSQCQFLIGIDEEPKFRVVRHLLGPHGQHVKDIAEKTGAKLRLRGRGSKFLEGPEQLESTDPLMLCVSAPDGPAYDEAKLLTRKHIQGVYMDYCNFCETIGIPTPKLRISLHEGPREGAYGAAGHRPQVQQQPAF